SRHVDDAARIAERQLGAERDHQAGVTVALLERVLLRAERHAVLLPAAGEDRELRVLAVAMHGKAVDPHHLVALLRRVPVAHVCRGAPTDRGLRELQRAARLERAVAELFRRQLLLFRWWRWRLLLRGGRGRLLRRWHLL